MHACGYFVVARYIPLTLRLIKRNKVTKGTIISVNAVCNLTIGECNVWELLQTTEGKYNDGWWMEEIN